MTWTLNTVKFRCRGKDSIQESGNCCVFGRCPLYNGVMGACLKVSMANGSVGTPEVGRLGPQPLRHQMPQIL